MRTATRRLSVSLSAIVCIGLGVALAVFGSARRDVFAAAPHCVSRQDEVVASKAGYGTVHFANSCSVAVQPALQREIARLHSFEASVGRFEAIAARDHGCAIALWGAAMSARGNPLGGALGESDIAIGRQLVDRALALASPRAAKESPRAAKASPRAAAAKESPTGAKTSRALIGAMDIYYRPYPDQMARARAYAEAMDRIHLSDPDDPDLAALDGLAIIEGVDLSDKTYSRQKRAGAILEAVMAAHPDHPGAPHYLIHAYDYTALASRAVTAATVYPTLAMASSHAQHMPSHIWSMLGRWESSIAANRLSGALIDPKAGANAVRGDIVFGHAFDFIAYARLQRGEDDHVAADLAALQGTAPVIVAARYRLERGDWAAAASLSVPAGDPFDTALARFTRAYGAARSGDAAAAERELKALQATRPQVRDAEGEYWAVFVDIYAKAAQAWLAKARGAPDKALALMQEAARMDDGHEKHIYLENKILPMRESLGDMQADLSHPAEALAAYRASLVLAPDRYRTFLGAAKAAAALGDTAAARSAFANLVALSRPGDHSRPGLAEAEAFLASHG